MNLSHLKVTSFVTNLDRASEETIRGGQRVPVDQWTVGQIACHASKDPKKCGGESEYNTACQSGIDCIPPVDEKPADVG